MRQLDKRLAALEARPPARPARNLSDFYADMGANPQFMADLYRGFIETGAVESTERKSVSRAESERTYHQIMR